MITEEQYELINTIYFGMGWDLFGRLYSAYDFELSRPIHTYTRERLGPIVSSIYLIQLTYSVVNIDLLGM
jgi:hypothetical protein